MTPFEVKPRYHIIIVVGEAEQGKTTWMIRHLARERQRKIYQKQYVNLKDVKLPGTQYVQTLDELDAIHDPAPKGIPTSIVGLDQLQNYCHARQSMSDRNVRFTKWVVETRQHGVDFVGTTWGLKMIDSNVRKYLDLTVLAEKKSDGFHYTYATPETLPQEAPEKILTFKDAQKWWDLFQSNELIPEVEA